MTLNKNNNVNNYIKGQYDYLDFIYGAYRFLSCVQLFLQLDSGTPQGVTQQVTLKVAQHLIGTSSCENIKLLNSVIQVSLNIIGSPVFSKVYKYMERLFFLLSYRLTS